MMRPRVERETHEMKSFLSMNWWCCLQVEFAAPVATATAEAAAQRELEPAQHRSSPSVSFFSSDMSRVGSSKSDRREASGGGCQLCERLNCESKLGMLWSNEKMLTRFLPHRALAKLDLPRHTVDVTLAPQLFGTLGVTIRIRRKSYVNRDVGMGCGHVEIVSRVFMSADLMIGMVETTGLECGLHYYLFLVCLFVCCGHVLISYTFCWLCL